MCAGIESGGVYANNVSAGTVAGVVLSCGTLAGASYLF